VSLNLVVATGVIPKTGVFAGRARISRPSLQGGFSLRLKNGCEAAAGKFN